MTMGEKLRKLRGNRTRAEVAKATNISVRALISYENDARRPRDEVKSRIATYYGCSIEELFFN